MSSARQDSLAASAVGATGRSPLQVRRFKAYPAYKDSGVEWLGEIPAHWEIVRLMRLTQSDRPIMYGIVLPGPDYPGGVPIVKGGDVAPDRESVRSATVP